MMSQTVISVIMRTPACARTLVHPPVQCFAQGLVHTRIKTARVSEIYIIQHTYSAVRAGPTLVLRSEGDDWNQNGRQLASCWNH